MANLCANGSQRPLADREDAIDNDWAKKAMAVPAKPVSQSSERRRTTVPRVYTRLDSTGIEVELSPFLIIYRISNCFHKRFIRYLVSLFYWSKTHSYVPVLYRGGHYSQSFFQNFQIPILFKL